MLIRKLSAAAVGAAIVLAGAAGAGAHQPFREPIELTPDVIPLCTFNIQFTPHGAEYQTLFDSGRVTVHAHGSPTLTNLDTGYSKVYLLRHILRQTFDADTNEFVANISGRLLFEILPGDVGPSGEVDPDGGMVYIVGQLRFTVDPDTFALTSFTVNGAMTDVCADLGG
jgi:hypothetical protein